MRAVALGPGPIARVLAALAFAAAITTAGCTVSSSSSRPVAQARLEPLVLSPQDTELDGTVRIASVFPTIGRYALSGIQSENGARMAVDDINRRGGIGGRRLKLLQYRTGSDFVDAPKAAEKAVSQGGVLALIGCNASSLSLPMAEVAEARRVVQVSNVSTADDLTWVPTTGVERQYVFRVCGSDELMADMLARFAATELMAKRVAVLYEVGRTYSARLAQSFVRAFHAPQEGRIAAEFFYLPLETDFRGQLKEIRTFGADVVFVPGGFADATLVARQAASVGLTVTLLGGDNWSSRLLFKRGAPAGRAFYGDLCSPPPAFGERYRLRFGHETDGCRAALAYDAVLAVAEALKVVGPLTDADLTTGIAVTRTRLRDALVRVDFAGGTGRIDFDRHRSRAGGMAIMELVPASDGAVVPRVHVRAPYAG